MLLLSKPKVCYHTRKKIGKLFPACCLAPEATPKNASVCRTEAGKLRTKATLLVTRIATVADDGKGPGITEAAGCRSPQRRETVRRGSRTGSLYLCLSMVERDGRPTCIPYQSGWRAADEPHLACSEIEHLGQMIAERRHGGTGHQPQFDCERIEIYILALVVKQHNNLATCH